MVIGCSALWPRQINKTTQKQECPYWGVMEVVYIPQNHGIVPLSYDIFFYFWVKRGIRKKR